MVVSITLNSDEDRKLYEQFRKLADVDHKYVTELLKELMAEYVKQHGDGNPNYTLEQSARGVLAYPTPWDKEAWTKENLAKYTPEEISDMIVRLSEALNVAHASAPKKTITSKVIALCPKDKVPLDVTGKYATCPVCRKFFEAKP